MTLVKSKELLERAKKEGYAVPAFNTSNLEVTLGIIRACEKLNSPVILATSEGEIGFSDEHYLFSILKSAADQAKVPVAIHLDHGLSFEMAKRCIDAGYTSVHFDGSLLSLDENILQTKEVVTYAKDKGISVEGEIGHVFTPRSNDDKTDRKQFFTDPDEAKKYIEFTGVDSLAISVGTAHGAYKGETKIDFERLKKISEKIETPIVLHGGSLVPDEDIKKAVECGVSKINVNTELRLSFTNYLREYLPEHPEEYVPEKIMKGAIDSVAKVCEDKIMIFGSSSNS